MQQFAREAVFADLRPMLAQYLGEDNAKMNQEEREDRLMMALTDTFASREHLAHQKAELLAELRCLFDNLHREFGAALEHLKEGNGSPGLHPMDKRLDRLEQRSSVTQRVRLHIVTATITVVITTGLGWTMNRMTAAPIANATATDQQKIDALEQKIDQLLRQQPVVTPAVEPTEQRRVRRPAPPMPKGKSQAMPDGAMRATDPLVPYITMRALTHRKEM